MEKWGASASDVYWFTNHVSPIDMIYPPESGINLATNKPTCVSKEFFLACDPLTVPRGPASPNLILLVEAICSHQVSK